MCGEGTDVIDQIETEQEETGKTYPVPSRKFTLTGKRLDTVLAKRFPYQVAFVIDCRTKAEGASAVVWIGETSDPLSYAGSYFDVISTKKNQHSVEYTFVPTQH